MVHRSEGVEAEYATPVPTKAARHTNMNFFMVDPLRCVSEPAMSRQMTEAVNGLERRVTRRYAVMRITRASRCDSVPLRVVAVNTMRGNTMALDDLRTEAPAELRGVLLQEHKCRVREGLV